MTNPYEWRPNGQKVIIQAQAIEPVVAFKAFVLPLLGDVNWIENSRYVSNTGMSAREWAGLVLHAFVLSDATGEDVKVAKTYDTSGDGAVVVSRGYGNEAVLVEQTLVTHKAHTNLETGVAERITAKSSRGENYSENNHLVLWLNITGDIDEKKIASLVANGGYNIVSLCGFREDDMGRYYLCYLFDKDKTDGSIHKISVKESSLIHAAESIVQDNS